MTQDIVYYTFVVDKETTELKVASMMKLPSKTRKKYIMDDLNRDTTLSQIDPAVIELIKTVI